MPGKRASKETSRTPRASVPRDGQRGERRCGQAGRCHRPRRGETTGRDTRSGLASRKPLARASGNFTHSKDALMFGGRERSGIA